MSFRAILVLMAVVLITTLLGAQEPSFPRDPAISPDGNEVCFVFDNDLWVVAFKGGTARRITNTTASEWGPSWSPDGKWIAFNSNREGQSYPYLISSVGGEARVIIRESYSVSDWYNDSKHLLVVRNSYEWGSSFYKLPIDGTRATLIGEFGDRFASLSPDNKKIVFQRYGDAYREAYRGSLNGDLWMLDIDSKNYTRLTTTEFTERYPRYSHHSNSLFYCYSDGDRFQLTRVDKMDFSRPFKVSNLPVFSARDISIARANDRIVFEHFNEIYKYDPTKVFGDRVSKLEIRLGEDNWKDTQISRNMVSELDDFTVSSDELLVAFNYLYDSFVMPRKGGIPRQITRDHSGYAGMHFIDDRNLIIRKLANGKEQLFTTKVDSLMEMVPYDWFGKDSLEVENVMQDQNGRWTVHYRDYWRSGRIAMADSGFVNLRPMNTPWVVISNFAVNQAGTHAVYSIIRDDNYMRELYIYDFATQTHRKILTDDGWISSIWWNQDERSLLMTRNRDIYRLDLVPRDEYELDVDNWTEIFSPPITKKTEEEKKKPTEKTEDETDELGLDEDEYVIDIKLSDEDESESSASDEEKPIVQPKPVEIEWEGIDKRFYPIITGSNTNQFVVRIISDSTFLYIDNPWFGDSNTSLKKANIYGKNIKEEANLGKDANSSFKMVGTTLYYLQKGALKSYNTSGGQRREIRTVLDYTYDTKELNKRVFEQAWGAFGNNFYDPDMHGKDWKQVYDFYRPYVEKARDIDDVATIINEMIGDVNASHTGFYPRAEGERNVKPAAFLGLDLDYSSINSDGVKVARVYPNTRLSSFYKLKAGDIINSIDGVQVNSRTPIDSLLAGKAGKQIRLQATISGDVKDLTIRALSGRENYDLWYAFKTNRSRELVEQLSNGRLGYVHIPAMGNENYNTFVRDVFRDNHDKEALVIDVRGNVGGRIHDMLITLLSKQTYAYSTSRRYSREKRPEPLRTIDKPTIVLVDERSFSDGEIFPIVYQEVGLGKVVGMPSSGAVIGTWEYTLVDGSSMRMPGSGWYKLDGTNMEGTGAMPDIVVENSLNDLLSGQDKQLERAVQELMKELK